MIPKACATSCRPSGDQLRAIEAVLCRRFAAYGYGEVVTPWLEYAETFEAADDDTLAAGYRLYDQQGRALMVRTDMTVPVARLAATRFHDKPLPLRFCYVAPSIRPWAPQRSQDGEFVQAGAELLGAALGGRRRRGRDAALRLPRRRRAARLPRRAGHGGLLRRPGRLARASTTTIARSSSRRSPTATTRCSRASPATPTWTTRRSRRCWRTPRAQRHARRPRAGAQAGHQRRHGRRHRAPGGGPRPRGGGRLRGRRHLRLRPLSRTSRTTAASIFEAYAPGRRACPSPPAAATTACWSASTGTSPAWASPSPSTALHEALGGGRRRARGRAAPCWPSSAASRSRRGRRSCAAPAGRWPRCPRRRRRARPCLRREGGSLRARGSPTAAP